MRSLEGEAGTNIATFADVNNDRYTDIVSVNDGRTFFTIHLFEPLKKMFIF